MYATKRISLSEFPADELIAGNTRLKPILDIVGYFRVGYYEQWDLTDNGLPGEELRGSLRSIYYKGIRRKGFGKEQREYWAQVGWALISPKIEHGMFYFQQISIFIGFA